MAAPRRRPSAWRENVESLLWAAALALLIRTFLMAPFKIPSGSMHPTLLEGDRILVNKFIYHLHPPRAGDIVVFYFPDDWRPFGERLRRFAQDGRPLPERLRILLRGGRPFIKRLIARGGDRVEIRDGRVLVNGTPVAGAAMFDTNRYLNQGVYGEAGTPVEVPPDMYYVLGDNSGSSHDSRAWGFVPARNLIGRALCIFWPPRRIRVLH
jgi:signal peptidase I